MTGMTVLRGKTCVSCTEVTDVYFRPLTQQQIDTYVASGDPMDKAGSYAVQGRTSLYIDKIDGCYFNVVGLPVRLLAKLIKQLGLNLEQLIK
jgi:septum formation protein